MKSLFLLPVLLLLPLACQSQRAPLPPLGQTPSGRVPRQKPYDPVVLHLSPPRSLEVLQKTPLYQFNEREVDLFLRDLFQREKDPLKRLVLLARKNLGQPYEIYCLGEFPFELYDPDPLYRLDRSDCVTFTEHMYSMALAKDWPSFFHTLIRIRYKEGIISVATRNHYTAADWNPNNAWLFEDWTAKLGAPTKTYQMRVDRARMLKKSFGIDRKIPTEIFPLVYIPRESLTSAYPHLQNGDIVEVIKGKGQGRWVGHVGLFVRGPGGEPHFLHSTAPKVREESLPGYVDRMKAKVFGLKFLRLKSPR
ncbi:MAG TPA: DUF1460 domain-containing protein [Planctomycetes bacterium]|nr:DUF1460 domain-containing protein [Planctomycetota bacterium]